MLAWESGPRKDLNISSRKQESAHTPTSSEGRFPGKWIPRRGTPAYRARPRGLQHAEDPHGHSRISFSGVGFLLAQRNVFFKLGDFNKAQCISAYTRGFRGLNWFLEAQNIIIWGHGARRFVLDRLLCTRDWEPGNATSGWAFDACKARG